MQMQNTSQLQQPHPSTTSLGSAVSVEQIRPSPEWQNAFAVKSVRAQSCTGKHGGHVVGCLSKCQGVPVDSSHDNTPKSSRHLFMKSTPMHVQHAHTLSQDGVHRCVEDQVYLGNSHMGGSAWHPTASSAIQWHPTTCSDIHNIQ